LFSEEKSKNDKSVLSDSKPKKKRLLSPKPINEVSRLRRNLSPESNPTRRTGLYERDRNENTNAVDKLYMNSKRSLVTNQNSKINNNSIKKNKQSSFADSDLTKLDPPPVHLVKVCLPSLSAWKTNEPRLQKRKGTMRGQG